MSKKKKPPPLGKGTLSDEDAQLWQRVTTTIRPLDPTHQHPYVDIPVDTLGETPDSGPKHKTRPHKPRHPIIPVSQTSQAPQLDHGRAPGLDKRNNQRLIKGKMAIDARLDLHGSTQQEAHRDLNGFIERCYARNFRCVLVITGKGLRLSSGEIGVLRRAVPQWLNDQPLRSMILGFSHATPKDGGEGALYVLLKRKR
ncbi:MAG: hypothetical protein HN644_11650 [Rhodospirillales bacterium]|jgi:DNA-nicking Smr family endonuclease|nr:hypothetical protein [Rhodospirillaceae bacterium]MBT3556442.1 hypothetical protein [Rhodospirillales bacterium]MBT4039291.1 hypothetical protein [Rhodospirillales bacterium]MBT4628243.1 hypothetical protein [Rhodospirillales bacterium]MBT5351992.1 hypothetical protein [Rhodospirillales bacterium]